MFRYLVLPHINRLFNLLWYLSALCMSDGDLVPPERLVRHDLNPQPRRRRYSGRPLGTCKLAHKHTLEKELTYEALPYAIRHSYVLRYCNAMIVSDQERAPPSYDSEGNALEDPTAWLLKYGNGPPDDPSWRGKTKKEIIKARSKRKQWDLVQAHPNRKLQHKRHNRLRTQKCRKVRYKIIYPGQSCN